MDLPTFAAAVHAAFDERLVRVLESPA